MSKEIERKFLCVKDSFTDRIYNDSHSKHIIQGYLAIGPDGHEVRLRHQYDSNCSAKPGPQQYVKLFLTVKSGQGLSRNEVEIEISEDQFNALWPLAIGKINKIRKIYNLNETQILEIDWYGGDQYGLITVEVEFPNEAAANSFTPPDWFGPEVTEDGRFKNQSLATTSVEDMAKLLAEFKQ